MVFAICASLLEVITASIIVVFAQVLTKPEVGQKYLSMINFRNDLSPNYIVFYIALIVGIIYLVKNLVAAIEVFYQNFTIQKMNYCFKNKLLYNYAKSDYGFYLTRNSSLGFQVVGGDAELMFSSGLIAIASILSEGIIFLCLIGLIIFMNPPLALLVFGIGSIIGIFITKILLPQFYRWGQRLQDAALNCNQNLLQFFHAFKEIVLLRKQDSFVSSFEHFSRKKSHVHAIQTGTNALPRMVIEVLFMGLFITTIAFLCLEHESPLQMIGILGGYLYAGFRLMPGLNRMINQLNVFKSTIPSIERVYNEYTLIGNTENYLDFPHLQFKKSLVLDNVSFCYLNTEKNALNNISLTIKKGERIGIVGETGSGKSTLIDLILGLLIPQEGSILIDGEFAPNSYQWHQKIGYVPQSIYLIDDSIEANIAFGETNIDETKLNASIDAAQLRKFIKHLPGGIKTIVGERGVRLSGGERQRIAIARALYHNPEILIFDEATSALDHETESRVMETIQSISRNRTVLMIAHRLTTLKNCDRIVAMENGEIKDIIQYEALNNIF